MRFILIVFAASISVSTSQAQKTEITLRQALSHFEADPQMKHAIVGFSVVNSRTGKVVVEKNANVGLAAASCQKVITSVAALEILGPEYRYSTRLAYTGSINRGVLNGDLVISGSGDPTFGSWRWKITNDSLIVKTWAAAIRKLNVTAIEGSIRFLRSGFSRPGIPDGWICADIGNYYGAGAYQVNWHENQYDVILRSGRRVGDPVSIVPVKTTGFATGPFINELTSAEKGSGDNACIYLPFGSDSSIIRGTIPVDEKNFSISGAVIDPGKAFEQEFREALAENGISIQSVKSASDESSWVAAEGLPDLKLIADHSSPTLDSINYWFLKKSVNLYGEALLKTLALQNNRPGSTEEGVAMIKTFWAKRGIEESALNVLDGSGLSPQNRITAAALVGVMQYAGTKPWFNSFRNSLPEINGIRMKSGVIGGARSFTGYVNSHDGNAYTFAIIVNNFTGNSSSIIKKIYTLLDILK